MPRPSQWRGPATAVWVALAAAGCLCSQRREPPFGRARVQVGRRSIEVEVANTPDLIAQGLMGRRSLAPDQGMLFVYRVEQILAFWMKDTTVPLDLVFLDRDGRILEIVSMEPMNRRQLRSKARAKFALEMNRGWFAANGVKVGDAVRIPAAVAASAERR